MDRSRSGLMRKEVGAAIDKAVNEVIGRINGDPQGNNEHFCLPVCLSVCLSVALEKQRKADGRSVSGLGDRDCNTRTTHPASRPGCLCSNAASTAKTQAQTKRPRWPLQWKADGQSSDGSLLQSAVQERKLLIHCHPSSGWKWGGGVAEERERKDRATPDTRRLAFFKHPGMAPTYTHAHTHVKTHAYT
ncbi:hypothetical protein PAMP_022174 [Pampus punctatissimus]